MPTLSLALLWGCASDHQLLVADADYLDGEVIVGLNTGPSGYVGVLNDYGFTELDYDPSLDIARLDIGTMEVKTALTLIHDDDRLAFTEPNYVVESTAVSVDDPWYPNQWGLHAINASDAWEYGIGEGVVVAVLDTGVDIDGDDGLNHVVSGKDIVYDSDPTYDKRGHGTHVAGTIAQTTDNGYGVAGVAWGASIMPVKVLGNSGSGSMWGVAQGMLHACTNGADVINMSLGSWGSSQYIADAIDACHDEDVVLVAATGNNGANSLNYPARRDGIIAVGATYEGGGRSSYSNYGSGMELVAPGSAILQETPSGWGTYYGTSMATPHVAGVAALVRGAGIESHEEVREILQETAVDWGNSGYDTVYGYGYVDAEAAMIEAYTRLENETPETEDPEDEEETEPPEDEEETETPDEEEQEEEEEEEDEEEVDETAPTIQNFWANSPEAGKFTIHWETDEPADGYVEFDPWGDKSVTADGYDTEHERTFTASSGYWYRFRIKSTDEAGNQVVSPWWKVYVN